MIRVNAGNGVMINFPDGTSSDEIERAMQEQFGDQQADVPPSPVALNGGGAVPPEVAAPPPASSAQKFIGRAPVPANFDPEEAKGFGRSLLGGALLNFRDEATAGIKGLFSDKPYKDLLAEEQKKDEDYAKAHPTADIVGSTIGGFAGPANLLLPGAGFARSTASGLASGLVAGAGEGKDTEDRVRSAGVGGTIGGVLGGTLPFVGKAAKGLWKGLFQGDEATASTELIKNIQRDIPGQTPERAVDIAVDRAQSVPERTIADTGESTRRFAGNVKMTPSQGSQELTEQLTSRQIGSPERVRAILGDVTGNRNAVTTVRELRKSAFDNSRPIYDEAFEYGPVYNDRIKDMLDDPIAQEGLRRGITIEKRNARAEGRPFDIADYAVTDFDAAGDPIVGKVPNTRMLDTIKKGMDDILEKYRSDVTGRLNLDGEGRSIDNLRRNLLTEVDKINPKYAEARAAFGGEARSASAIQSGKSFMKGDLEDQELAFADLTPGDREFFLLGMFRYLQDQANKGSGETSIAATQRYFRPETQTRLRAFLGEDMLNGLNRTMRDEQEMQRTFTRATGNSQTAERIADQRDVGDAGSFVADLMQGKPVAAVSRSVGRALSDKPGMTEGLSDQASRLLMAQSTPELELLRGNLQEFLRNKEAKRRGGRNLMTGGITGLLAGTETN